MTEAEFQGQLRELCKMLGVKYYHTWRSVKSAPGFPDTVIAAPPRLIIAELKSETGIVSAAQQEWLDALGQCETVETYLWRPSDFDGEIANTLRPES